MNVHYPPPARYGTHGNRPAEAAAMQFSTADLLAELDESENVAADGSWTVGYLDVLLLMLTLLAVLLGVTYMQVGETTRKESQGVELTMELPVAAAPPLELDPRTLLAAYQVRPPAPPAVAAAPGAAEKAPVDEPALPKRPVAAPAPPVPAPEPAVTVAAKVPAVAPPPQPELPPALRRLAAMVADDAGDLLELLVGEREVRMEVRDDILFPLGSAEMSDSGRALLGRLADMLAEQQAEIAIEGHTDDLPIATERFPSNWELSSYRATTVARYLIEQGVPAQRLRATGYADTRPRVFNDSAENRSRNRRVSIVLHLPAADVAQRSAPPRPLELPERSGWRRL